MDTESALDVNMYDDEEIVGSNCRKTIQKLSNLSK